MTKIVWGFLDDRFRHMPSCSSTFSFFEGRFVVNSSSSGERNREVFYESEDSDVECIENFPCLLAAGPIMFDFNNVSSGFCYAPPKSGKVVRRHRKPALQLLELFPFVRIHI